MKEVYVQSNKQPCLNCALWASYHCKSLLGILLIVQGKKIRQKLSFNPGPTLYCFYDLEEITCSFISSSINQELQCILCEKRYYLEVVRHDRNSRPSINDSYYCYYKSLIWLEKCHMQPMYFSHGRAIGLFFGVTKTLLESAWLFRLFFSAPLSDHLQDKK